MVRLNNSFDGFTSTKVIDAYIRNLHDYRVVIEVSSLWIINFLLSRKENPSIIPTTQFESIRSFLEDLTRVYHKMPVSFVCNDDENNPLYRYHQELNLISKIVFQSRKNYVYCLNDVIDFYLDNGLSIEDLLIPKNITYVSNLAVKEFHKYLPEGFDKIETDYKSLESNSLIKNDEIVIQDLYKNPQNLYLRLLGEIVEKGIDYLILQLYDFLIEETNKTDSVLTIKSNKLIQIWDDINFVSQNQRCKPSLDKKIKLLPLNKTKIKNKDEMFDYVIEEWAANISRALELKVKLGIDFINYINTCNDIKFIENYENHVYPSLSALAFFMEKKLGSDQIKKRFCFL